MGELSIRSLRETQRRVKEIGAYGGDAHEGTPPDTIELHVVRWDRGAAKGSLFPGARYDYDSAADTKTEREAIWLRALPGGPPADCYFWAKITGQHTDGVLIYTPVSSLTFKAKLTTRTSVSCGSGSGTGGPLHTVYKYGIIGVKHVLDGDGCPAWIDTELGPDISGTAFEWNNHKVALGTIVDVETVFREDLSASGSGDGIASGSSCVHMFAGDATPAVFQQPAFYRVFCIGEKLGEYVAINGGAVYTLSQDLCVACGCSGSGSACAVCDSPPTSLCLAIPTWPACLNYLANCPPFGGGVPWPPAQMTVTYVGTIVGSQVPTQVWRSAGLTGGGCDLAGGHGTLWYAQILVVCGTLMQVAVSTSPFNADGSSSDAIALYGEIKLSSPCALPQNIALHAVLQGYPGTSYASACGSGTLVTSTVSTGACAGDSGSGAAGGCKCQWQADITGAFTTLLYSDGSCSCTIPPSGSPNEIRNTNCDGTTCTGGGGGTGPACGTCGTAGRIGVFSGGFGFLAGYNPGAISLAYGPQADTWTGSLVGFTCGEHDLRFWCENGTWYCGISGGNGVAALPGGTCALMNFTLIYGTDNTICPGQTGQVTVAVQT